MVDYFVLVDDRIVGPLTAGMIVDRLSDRFVLLEDLVAQDGWTEWKPISKVFPWMLAIPKPAAIADEQTEPFPRRSGDGRREVTVAVAQAIDPRVRPARIPLPRSRSQLGPPPPRVPSHGNAAKFPVPTSRAARRASPYPGMPHDRRRHDHGGAPARQRSPGSPHDPTPRHGRLLPMLFSFRGRASRLQFWMIAPVALAIVGVMGICIATALDFEETPFWPSLAASAGSALIALWVSLAVQVKRWHDRGKSGWWILINVLPIIGSLWALVELGFLPPPPEPDEYDFLPDAPGPAVLLPAPQGAHSRRPGGF